MKRKLESLMKYQVYILELNSSVYKNKISVDKFDSRFDIAGENINEAEGKSIENTQI